MFCVPGVPRGLGPVLEHYGISVAVATELPADFDVPPTLLLVDLAACSHEELRRLRRTAGRSILVGLASKPLVDAERAKIASELPAVFVLPHQSGDLVETIDRFFKPIHRKHPRIDARFSLLLDVGGKKYGGDGINLSLSGCAGQVDEPLTPQTPVRGTISPEGSREAYRFEGSVAWCVEGGGGHRIGVDFQMDEATRAAFHTFLASALQRDLLHRWTEEIAHGR